MSDAPRPLLVASVVGWLGMGFSVLGGPPLYPDIARDLRTAPDGLGLAVGIASLVAIFFQIPMGLAADRIGVRRLLIGGLALIVAACGARALAPDLLTFILSQALLGIAVPAFQAGSFTGLANAFSGARLTSSIAYCFSAFQVGLVLSSVVVGALGALTDWRTTLFILALVPAVALPAALRVAEVRPAPQADASVRELARRSLRFLLRRRPLTLATVSILSMWCSMANVFALPFALRQQGIDAATTGLLLGAAVLGSIVSGPLMSRLAHRAGMRNVMIGGFALSAVSIGLLAVTGIVPVAVAASFFMLGAGTGGIAALTQSDASSYAAGAGIGHGAALSAMRLAQSLGAGLGPAMAGTLYVQAGFGGAQLGGVVFVALAAALLLSLRPRLRTMPERPPAEE